MTVVQKQFATFLLLAGCAGAQSTTAGTATVQDMKVVREGSIVRVEITLSTSIKPSIITAKNPERLVLELPNTLSNAKQRQIPVNYNRVRRVRLGLNSAAPPITHVVVDLDQTHPYVLRSDGNRIILTLSPGGESRARVRQGAPAAAASGGLIGVFRRRQGAPPPVASNDSAPDVTPAPPSGPPIALPNSNQPVLPDSSQSITASSPVAAAPVPLLKPSGAIGVKLGLLGFAMFLGIFLYPLRKRWPWLSRQGNSKHWLDIHVLLGITAPFVIALHSSFKFRGFAGIAFWIMVAVSLSGVIGRYLYAQIPRSLNAAEMSLKELQEVQASLTQQLADQAFLPQADLRSLLRLPSAERVRKLSIAAALGYMLALDLARGARVAKLRRHALSFGEALVTLGGFLATQHADLERAITAAREEAATAKRVLFLSRAQQVFHLWHVVHKPFSYSFAILALIHIAVVTMMGFF